jgi:hypothetical protein
MERKLFMTNQLSETATMSSAPWQLYRWKEIADDDRNRILRRSVENIFDETRHVCARTMRACVLLALPLAEIRPRNLTTRDSLSQHPRPRSREPRASS